MFIEFLVLFRRKEYRRFALLHHGTKLGSVVCPSFYENATPLSQIREASAAKADAGEEGNECSGMSGPE